VSNLSAATGKLLALSMLKGIGPATLRKIARILDFDLMDNHQLAAQLPSNATILRDDKAWSDALLKAEKQVEEAEKRGARILSPLDPEYPKLLAGTKDDPFLLFVRGKLAQTPAKSVAIIGTREPTGHGGVIAQRITHFFVEQGWSVVSGLAIGCDATAHQAALEKGGHTVAVLAHGLHTIAPARHRRLADDILAQGGALVSEYHFGVDAQPQFFAKRDRIQAGMAQGVVMIQSDHKGGSLHASRATLEYGRWLAVPYPTEQDRVGQEPKIQANLTLAEGSVAERAELLRCPPAALAQVMILRGREDYGKMVGKITATAALHRPVQSGLL
jgi:DNA processing protein